MTTPSVDLLSMTVGEIMAYHPQAAAILGAHRVDVCRHAHLALPTAVRIAAAHLEDVRKDLSRVLATPLHSVARQPVNPSSGQPDLSASTMLR